MAFDLRVGAERKRWRKKGRPVGRRVLTSFGKAGATPARVGALPAKRGLPSGWEIRCAAGSDLTADELREYLDCLNGRAEALNVDVIAFDGLAPGGKLDGFDRAGWEEFLTTELPQAYQIVPPMGRVAFPGRVPIYTDGPQGWRDYFKANRGNPLALNARTQGITDEAHEYQVALADWYERIVKAGGKAALVPPRRPTVEELPGAIEPVPTLSDVTEPVIDVVLPALESVSKGARDALTAGLGVTPTQLKYGAAGLAGVVLLVALAPYARLLGGSR